MSLITAKKAAAALPVVTAFFLQGIASYLSAYRPTSTGSIAPEPMVILKGMSAASYYCKPSGRVLGDIDFLTDPAKTDELLD